MSTIRGWIHRLLPGLPNNSAGRRRTRRLVFEQFEDRRMMADLRTTLGVGEGYLYYTPYQLPGDQSALFGHESVGETKTTNPNGATNDPANLGYDWHGVQADLHVVKHLHPNGMTSMSTTEINKGFEFANQIYAQAGITVKQSFAGVAETTVPATIESRDDVLEIVKHNRGSSDQVNVWYVNNLTDAGGSWIGVTRAPNHSFPAVVPGTDDGIIIDTQGILRDYDTLAHELGHYLVASRKTNGVLLPNGKHYKYDNIGTGHASPDLGQFLMHPHGHKEAEADLIQYNKKSPENNAPADPLLNPYTRMGQTRMALPTGVIEFTTMVVRATGRARCDGAR